MYAIRKVGYQDRCMKCVTRYVYSATGEKLRVVHQTAVPNITVAIGSARELSKHL